MDPCQILVTVAVVSPRRAHELVVRHAARVEMVAAIAAAAAAVVAAGLAAVQRLVDVLDALRQAGQVVHDGRQIRLRLLALLVRVQPATRLLLLLLLLLAARADSR